nr:hypothetical protein [uncultured Dyadobacter sp.]
MKNLAIFLFPILLAVQSCGLKTSVLYGERNTHGDVAVKPNGLAALTLGTVEPRDTLYHVVRIFIDREGIIYPPDQRILRAFLIGNNYSFLPYQSQYADSAKNGIISCLNPRFYPLISAAYKPLLETYYRKHELTTDDLHNFRRDFNRISRDTITARLTRLIHDFGYQNVTFLMVGFNNTFVNDHTSHNSSEAKLDSQICKIQEILDASNYRRIILKDGSEIVKTLFIEVHWDGRFVNEKGIKTGLNYQPALISSYKAGLALRGIMSGIDAPNLEINMMSHSSGANVICESLFNQRSKVRAYAASKSELFKLLEHCYRDTSGSYLTPSQSKVNAFLMEASLPGIETFMDYYKRNRKDGKPLESDNYRIILGYNVNDPDLGKRFGKKWIGKLLESANYNGRLINGISDSFGSTALGALESEVIRTREYFRRYHNVQNFQPVNFSYNQANGHKAPNTFHDVGLYLNLPEYRNAIHSLYGL